MRPSSGFVSGYAAPTQDSAAGVLSLRDSFAAQAATSYPYRDASISSVQLLLHGNGANGSTTITDSSPSARTLTALGSATNSTAQRRFGTASILTPNATSPVGVPHADIFKLGTQTFTLEAWIYPNSVAQAQAIFYSGHSGTGWALYMNAAGSLGVYLSSDGTSWNISNFGITTGIVTGRWQHVVLQRSGSTWSLYCDGVRRGTLTSSASIYYPTTNPTYSFYLGVANSAANCYYDEVRFTAGVARYAGASYALPNGAYPDR